MDKKFVDIAIAVAGVVSIGASIASSILGAKKQELQIQEEVAKAIEQLDK